VPSTAARYGRTATGPAVRIRDVCSEEGSPLSVTRRKHSNGRSQLRRRDGVGSTLTLQELVEEYLAQHDAEPETIDKLGGLLAKALRAFGGRRLPELRSQEIAAWRMTISAGHRFEATKALRQVLARAVVWEMIDSNPAKQGVDNPQRRRTEKRPFESWAQLPRPSAKTTDATAAIACTASHRSSVTRRAERSSCHPAIRTRLHP
jgi:hypothetical protein